MQYRLLIGCAMAALVAAAQKIETQQPGRTRITTVETALRHLSVIELRDEVEQVAVGSQSYKVEWRGNKVFIQPLEPASQTNLFIWTRQGRYVYRLITAPVEQMHFAVDQADTEPPPPSAPTTEPNATSVLPKHGTPVRTVGLRPKSEKGVAVHITDLYMADGRWFLRYQLRNEGPIPYEPSAPTVVAMVGASAGMSILPLAATQLVGPRLAGLHSASEVALDVAHSEFSAERIAPGQIASGIVGFDVPPQSGGVAKTALRLEFARVGREPVVAFLVL